MEKEKIKKLEEAVAKCYEVERKILEKRKAIDDIIESQREMVLKGKMDYVRGMEERKKELYEEIGELTKEKDEIGKKIEKLTGELIYKGKLKDYLKRKFLIIPFILILISLFFTQKTGFFISSEFLSPIALLLSLLILFLLFLWMLG